MLDKKETDASVIVETALSAAEPTHLDPKQFYSMVVPDGATGQLLDMENLLEAPRRKRCHVTVWDAESLSQYVNTHKEDGTNLFLVFKNTNPSILAVLNDHAEDAPGWGDHTVALEFKETEAWAAWRQLSGQYMDQTQFAEHIENHLIDIASPTGADLLELAQTFEATTTAEFRSQKRLSNGQRQFQYTENIEGRGGSAGELQIPESFQLQIAPFEGCKEYPMRARLRFRLRSGNLSLAYILENERDVKRVAVNDVATQVATSTELFVMYGEPHLTGFSRMTGGPK